MLGLKAQERLAGLLRTRSVAIARDGEDRYHRTLARVSVGGLDVGSILLGEGLALP
jgi:endonuclease YncB( thermonuclease family)